MYAPGTKKLTPVMRQYAEAKSAYPDAILFFRLGDFYEMFNDDAVVAARELDLTLTSRNKNAEHPVPMAGIPFHSAHNYLSRLIARGHKVAICDQMGDPSRSRPVPRKVVRAVTPGLLTDSDQLTPRRNNYLCAVEADEGQSRIGIALLDLSTAEPSVCTALSGAAAVAEMTRADPRNPSSRRTRSHRQNARHHSSSSGPAYRCAARPPRRSSHPRRRRRSTDAR